MGPCGLDGAMMKILGMMIGFISALDEEALDCPHCGTSGIQFMAGKCCQGSGFLSGAEEQLLSGNGCSNSPGAGGGSSDEQNK